MRSVTTKPSVVQIVHILHVDKLASVLREGGLWCDAEVRQHDVGGTEIGFPHIKARRLKRPLRSWPGLHVGECVPFYFWPRSVMLYMYYKHNNPELPYVGGQEPIVHLVADFGQTIDWAAKNKARWAFTDGNAGSRMAMDYKDEKALQQLDWEAISAERWDERREAKQAEFLLERFFPFGFVQRIGVFSEDYRRRVCAILEDTDYSPRVQVQRDWYYGD